jgi:hypothetical protein
LPVPLRPDAVPGPWPRPGHRRLAARGRSFHCHKTLSYESEDGTGEVTGESKHCAGALITMEREGFANQMMRIGERLGFYDPAALVMDSPVYDSLAVWVAAHDPR